MLTKKVPKHYIVLSVVILTLIMNVVDGFLKPPYVVKSLIKVVLFFTLPMRYYMVCAEERKHLKELFIPRKKEMLTAFLLGAVCFVSILGAYLILKDRFDFSGVTRSLTGDSGITSDNFIFVAIYISFFNSFLEEFFFRGYAFLALRPQVRRGFAYLFSSFFFAFYHVGMTMGWLHFAVFILELAGLWIGGLIFNFLNEKSNTIYPSWIVHMFCNFGINTIGFLLFDMI